MDYPEWMDEPGCPEVDLRDGLRDLERLNRYLGGASTALSGLSPLLRSLPPGSAVSVLDVATGGADVPRAAAARASRQGRPLRVTCLDLHPTTLRLARQRSAGLPELSFVRGDARRLPFGDGAFDISTCSLALHHFPPEEAVEALSEMRRVARLGVVVSDLRRSRAGCALVWVLTRLMGAGRLTRHDGPLSMLRAYTPVELRELAARAGLSGAHVRSRPFYRVSLVHAAE